MKTNLALSRHFHYQGQWYDRNGVSSSARQDPKEDWPDLPYCFDGIKFDQLVEGPDEVSQLLDASELPKIVTSRKAVDHKIKLAYGAKDPTQTLYQIVPLELVVLKRNLNEFLDASYFRPWGPVWCPCPLPTETIRVPSYVDRLLSFEWDYNEEQVPGVSNSLPIYWLFKGNILPS